MIILHVSWYKKSIINNQKQQLISGDLYRAFVHLGNSFRTYLFLNNTALVSMGGFNIYLHWPLKYIIRLTLKDKLKYTSTKKRKNTILSCNLCPPLLYCCQVEPQLRWKNNTKILGKMYLGFGQ